MLMVFNFLSVVMVVKFFVPQQWKEKKKNPKNIHLRVSRARYLENTRMCCHLFSGYRGKEIFLKIQKLTAAFCNHLESFMKQQDGIFCCVIKFLSLHFPRFPENRWHYVREFSKDVTRGTPKWTFSSFLSTVAAQNLSFSTLNDVP